MPYRLGLFSHRRVLLGIRRRIHPRPVRNIRHPADIQKTFGHIQIQPLARIMIQLHQPQLDFLMPRRLVDGLAVIIVGVSLKEGLVDMPGALFRNIQQFGLAGRLRIRYGRFIKMTYIIQLVAVEHITVRTRPHFAHNRIAADMRNIQIAIRLLGPGNNIDNPIHGRLNLGIRLGGNHQCRPFHHLIQVRGIKPMGFGFGTAFVFQVFSTHPQPPLGYLRLGKGVRQRILDQHLDPRRPDPIIHFYLLKRNHFHRLRGRHRRTRNNPAQSQHHNPGRTISFIPIHA